MINACESSDLIKSHAKWKMKLATAVACAEWLDVENIAKDNCCTLGKWLNSEDTVLKISELHHYRDCVEKHTAFHIEAAKIAEMINTKRNDEAISLLHCNTSVFNSISNAVILSIFLLFQELEEMTDLPKDFKMLET